MYRSLAEMYNDSALSLDRRGLYTLFLEWLKQLDRQVIPRMAARRCLLKPYGKVYPCTVANLLIRTFRKHLYDFRLFNSKKRNLAFKSKAGVWMKCCLITPYPPDRCGIAIYSKGLASELAKYIEVSVIANRDEGALKIEDVRGVKVVRCWRRHTLTYLLKIFRATTHERPDIIHVQHEYLVYGARKYSVLFPFLLMLLRLLRRPIILTMHSVILLNKADEDFFYEHGVGRRFPSIKRGLMILVTKLLHLLSDVVIVHKELMKRILVQQYGFDKRKIKVIPHGVTEVKPLKDAKLRLGLSGDVIVFTGFIIPGKGVEILVETFSRLKEKHHDATLIIAGGYHPRLKIENPWYIGSIERALRRSGVEKEIIFMNKFVPDNELNLYLSAADIIVLPYTDDSVIGASGALGRCALLGKPIIATSIPRFLEDLEDGLNAMLVKPGDVEALTETLERLLDDPSLRRRVAGALRDWASKRGWRKVALQTLKLYKESTRASNTHFDPENRKSNSIHLNESDDGEN